MKSSIFKAYDIRGKYPTEINEKVVSEIAVALARHFKKGTIVVGRDIRLSSPSLYRAAIKQLRTKNLKLKTIPIGLATTPMFYFLVNYLKAVGGIMITASHNPKEFNGLKVVGRKAAPMSGKDILRIMNYEL